MSLYYFVIYIGSWIDSYPINSSQTTSTAPTNISSTFNSSSLTNMTTTRTTSLLSTENTR